MNNILTASRQACLLACPRKHYWRYEIGLQTEAPSLALRFGSAWARAKEAYRKGADYDAALAAACPEGVDLDLEVLFGIVVWIDEDLEVVVMEDDGVAFL